MKKLLLPLLIVLLLLSACTTIEVTLPIPQAPSPPDAVETPANPENPPPEAPPEEEPVAEDPEEAAVAEVPEEEPTPEELPKPGSLLEGDFVVISAELNLSALSAAVEARADFDTVMDVDNPTYDELMALQDIPGVAAAQVSYQLYIGSGQLEVYDPFEHGVQFPYALDFRVHGMSSPEPFSLASGYYSLIDGRVPTQAEIDAGANVVMIMRQLAEQNNLSVGDSFMTNLYLLDYDASATQTAGVVVSAEYTRELEIVGIYDFTMPPMHPEEVTSMYWYEGAMIELYNTLWVPNDIPRQLFMNALDYELQRNPEYWASVTEHEWTQSFEAYYAVTDLGEVYNVIEAMNARLPHLYHAVIRENPYFPYLDNVSPMP